MTSFSAALLAGGQSTRMGRDKALLPVPNSGLLLWQRQLALLDELQPDEIFWSGPPRPHLPARLRIVADEVPDAGPLGGVSACLNLMRSDLLLVLAIDLPQMEAFFLTELLQRCSSTQGCVMHQGRFFEPLAAVYPRSIASLAQQHLHHRHYALQDLVREAIEQKMMQSFPVVEESRILFRNWNTPTS